MYKSIFNVVGVVAVVSMILMGCSDGGGDNPVGGGKTDSKLIGTWIHSYGIVGGVTTPSIDVEITFLKNGIFENNATTQLQKGTYTISESSLSMLITDIYLKEDEPAYELTTGWYTRNEYNGAVQNVLGQSINIFGAFELPRIYSINENTLTLTTAGNSPITLVYTKK
jgi:hypothetical protein